MSAPLVSVIMPLYNKRPYVRRAVASVQGQTFPDWELIVVDDGSTDGSWTEVPADDPRIMLVRQENRGPGAARNRGAGLASGRYVSFIDADDYYYPEKLRIEMDLLWKRRRADWMMSGYAHETQGRVTVKFIRERGGDDIREGSRVFHDAHDQLTVSGWPSDGICMWKKLFEMLGGFREDMRYLEITELLTRCGLLSPRVAVHAGPLYRVVDVPGSTSKMTHHHQEAMLQWGETLHRLSKEYPQYAGYLTAKGSATLYSYAASMILMGKGQKAREYLSRRYPFGHDRKWLKLWAGSWLPTEVVRHLVGHPHRRMPGNGAA